MYRIKLQYGREPWSETGRTFYIEAVTASQARSNATEIIDGSTWRIFAVERIQGSLQSMGCVTE